MKHWIIFLFAAALFSCKQNSKPQVEEQSQTFVRTDSLQTFSNGSQTFYFIGGTLDQMKAVGVPHKDSSIGVRPEFADDYEFLWNSYFESKGISSDTSLILAMEMTKESFPDKNLKFAQRIILTQPGLFIDQNLFSRGVRYAAIGDQRKHSMEIVQLMWQGDKLFTERGGLIEINGTDNFGFPKPVVKQYPTLNEKDILWLKKQWHDEVYVQDSIFDENLYKFLQKRPTIKDVVGGAHAYRLWRDYKVPVGIVGSMEDISFAVMREEVIKYYLEQIRK